MKVRLKPDTTYYTEGETALMVFVLFVLLIACGNVANLFPARSVRERATSRSDIPLGVFASLRQDHAYENISRSSATPIVTVPPSSSFPNRISSVSGSRTSRWMTRASGRAPIFGS